MSVRSHRSRARVGVCGLNPHAGESGHLGREEIEKMHAFRVNDILRRIPGIHVTYTATGEIVESSRGVSGFSSGSCTQYYIDGMPWLSMEPGDINAWVNGNEVYQGPNTPAEFTHGPGACLTIVLWTRFKIRDLR